jgi:hypothetical protein
MSGMGTVQKPSRGITSAPPGQEAPEGHARHKFSAKVGICGQGILGSQQHIQGTLPRDKNFKHFSS